MGFLACASVSGPAKFLPAPVHVLPPPEPSGSAHLVDKTERREAGVDQLGPLVGGARRGAWGGLLEQEQRHEGEDEGEDREQLPEQKSPPRHLTAPDERRRRGQDRKGGAALTMR